MLFFRNQCWAISLQKVISNILNHYRNAELRIFFLESPKVYPSVQQNNQYRIQSFPQQKPADFMEDESQVLPYQNQNLQNQSNQPFLMLEQQQFQEKHILLNQNSAQNQNMNANYMGQLSQIGNNRQVSNILIKTKKFA